MLFVAVLLALVVGVGRWRRRSAGGVSPVTPAADAALDVLYAEIKGLAEREALTCVQRWPDGVVVTCMAREGDFYFHVEDVRKARLAGYVVLSVPGGVIGPAADVCRVPQVRLRAGYDHALILSCIYNHALRQGYCLLNASCPEISVQPAWRRLEPLYLAPARDPLGRFIASSFALGGDGVALGELVLGHGWSARRFAELSGLQVL